MANDKYRAVQLITTPSKSLCLSISYRLSMKLRSKLTLKKDQGFHYDRKVWMAARSAYCRSLLLESTLLSASFLADLARQYVSFQLSPSLTNISVTKVCSSSSSLP